MVDTDLNQEKKVDEQIQKLKGTTKTDVDLHDDNDDDDDVDDDDAGDDMNDIRPNILSRGLLGFQKLVLGFVVPHKRQIITVVLVGLLLAYLAYVAYAMYYRFGDEGSIRLLVCTLIGLLFLTYNLIKLKMSNPVKFRFKSSHTKRMLYIIRWSLYISSAGFSVVFIIMDVALNNPLNLVSLAGLAFFIFVCCLFSQRPEKLEVAMVDLECKQEKGIYKQVDKPEGKTKNFEDDKDDDEDDSDEDDEDDADTDKFMKPNMLSRGLLTFQNGVKSCIAPHRNKILKWILSGMLLAFLGYVAYAMYYRFGDEGSIRLLVCTLIGLFFLGKNLLKEKLSCRWPFKLTCIGKERALLITRWTLYLLSGVFSIVFIVMDVALKQPRNLISLAGLFGLLFICCIFSQRPAKINWHTIYWCVMLQFLLALFIVRTSLGNDSIMWVTDRVNSFLANAYKGSAFTFAAKYKDHNLIFGAFPTILYINAFVAVLYYVGFIQWVVRVVGRFLTFVLHISPAEAMCVATNILLDSPSTGVAMKPYLLKMNKSELFTVLVAGQASVSGGFLGIVASFGIPITYLIPACVMSAPATVAVSKLLLPASKPVYVNSAEMIDTSGMYTSLLDAVVQGAVSTVSIVSGLVVNFYVFYSVLSFLNETLEWFGDRVGVQHFTFDFLCSYLFFPFPVMMGADIINCANIGRLIGYKLVGSASLSYMELSRLRENRETFDEYRDTNGTWKYIENDLFLEDWNMTLQNGFLTKRSEIIATYSLCGLCNMVAIGSALAVFYILLPKRRRFLGKTAMPSLVAGNIACFMTACFAGMLYRN